MSPRKTQVGESGAADAAADRQDDAAVDPREREAALEAQMDRLEVLEADLRRRMEDLDRREAALAPRERENEQALRSRAADETVRRERPSIDQYRPPNQLEVPADGEYDYRWVAEYVNGNQTPRAVQERLREGYERVLKSDLPEDFLVDQDTYGDGYARTTGLILMRIPKARNEARRQYYRRLSQDRLHSADELQGVAGRDRVHEDRGSRSLTGREAGEALKRMSAS